MHDFLVDWLKCAALLGGGWYTGQAIQWVRKTRRCTGTVRDWPCVLRRGHGGLCQRVKH